MHISLDEALTLLNGWKNRETPLDVYVSRPGFLQDLQGKVRELQGTTVEVHADRSSLQLDLQGADFNGDGSSREYLVCEFRDGKRYSFYGLRANAGV
jgi:hypothetical protein